MKSVRLLSLSALLLTLAASGCKKTPEAPSEPDKVVIQGVEAIKANKPANVYAMLPASYQADVQVLVTDATSKVDPELFELVVKIIDKTVAILDKHGEALAQNEMVKALPVDFKEVVALVKEFHGILKDSGLTSYDKLKGLQLAEFLSDHGEKFMAFSTKVAKKFGGEDYAGGMKRLDSVTAKTLSTEGDKAEVEITADGKTEKSTFVKVEGKWIPEEMSKGWKPMIASAKTGVASGMEQVSKNKEQAKKTLEQVLAALDEVEKDGKLDPLMKMGSMLK
ncbi:MAG: hypothetical protein H6744_21725 [Deltaproteobacteria bacterium]|nr:hypothetical protein [Deltaproteobacteria bacterium]